MLDVLFKNVYVVDGSGRPGYKTDVGVRCGKITFNTTNVNAKEVVSGEGLTLCPGFIDSHSHGDLSIGTEHNALSKVSQGVTTEIGGQCGISAYPVNMEYENELRSVVGFAPDFFNMPYEKFDGLVNYIDYCEKLKLTNNMMALIGHNTLRVSVMGVADRAPNRNELNMMKEKLRNAMENGAVGISSGLIYVPGVYSETDELIELCRVIKDYDGIYATHMRDEAKNVVNSVKEAIYIAESAGVPLIISHHKICGRNFWGTSKETLKLVDEANSRSVRVYMDQYPYEANMTELKICIPPKYFSKGISYLMQEMKTSEWREKVANEMNDPNCDYDNFYMNSGGFSGVLISSIPNVPEAEGFTVAEYAKKVNKNSMDAYFDLLIESNCEGEGIFFAMNQEEVEKIYCHPKTIIGSDGLCSSIEEKGHPRAWGTFIRPLTLFCNKKNLISFEEAICKQTLLTAEAWGIKNKGKISEGYDADLVLIDRAKLREVATYKNSNQKADGIEAVYVSGECVYREKKLTGIYPGHFIRHR